MDELQVFVALSIVGGGKRSLSESVRLNLELLEERRFGSSMVYLATAREPPRVEFGHAAR